jgi:hypothetical protein
MMPFYHCIENPQTTIKGPHFARKNIVLANFVELSFLSFLFGREKEINAGFTEFSVSKPLFRCTTVHLGTS